MLLRFYRTPIIKNLTSNKYVAESKSKIIQNDSNRLKKMVNYNIFEDFFKQIDISKKEGTDDTTRKNNLPQISDEENKKLNQLRILLMEWENDQAQKLIEEQNIENIENIGYKVELLEMQLVLLHRMNIKDFDEYTRIIESLIRIKPKTESYYLDAANTFFKLSKKIEYIDKAINIYPKDYILYEKKGDILVDYYMNLIDKGNSAIKTGDITECYLKGIELNGSISNKSWVKLCEWYGELYKKDKETRRNKILDLLDIYSKQDKYHPNYLGVLYNNKNIINDNIDQLLIDGYEFSKEKDSPNLVELTLSILLNNLIEKNQKEEILKYMDEFEDEYNPSYGYLQKKADIFAKYFDRISDAIQILENINEDNYARNNLLIKLYAINKDKDKASKIISKFYNEDLEMQFAYNIEFEEYETACKIIEEYWETHEKTKAAYINYSYAKLKLERYKDIYWDLKKYYDNPATCTPEIAINYFIADINLNKLDKKKIESKIIDNKEMYDNDVIAAAYSLINDIPNALSYLSKAIKKDNLLKYNARDWPAFNNCKNDAKYKKIVGL